MAWTYLKKDDVDKYLVQYPQFSDYFSELVLLETEDAVFLPKLLINNYPSDYLVHYPGQKQVEPAKINLRFNGQLRPKQQAAINIVKNIYDKQGFVNGILKLFPGAGKTVLTVYLSHMLGLKTCVIVDNENLMKQWIEEYIKFSPLTIDDIGIIKQTHFITDKPVSVAMSQTLMSKVKNNFTSAFNQIDAGRFGLVVYDEVHNTSSSEQFAKNSILFRTPNVIGLSATPFQYGSAEVLMKNTIGEILYETNDYDLPPKYCFLYYDSKLGDKYGRKISFVRDYIKRKAMYNSVIVKSEAYFNTITKYTEHLKEKGHKTIIICMTKKQVQMVSQHLEDNGIENRRFYGEEKEIDKENDNVIVATYQFCGKGFNMPSLSALILACPLSGKKSIIQVVGRILRYKEGKKSPLVIDMCDISFPLIINSEIKRKKNIVTEEFKNCEIIEHQDT